MLRRDRHAPRWSQNRGAASASVPPNETVVPEVAEPAGSRARAVPIEAGPPPTPAVPVAEPPVPDFLDAAPVAPEPTPSAPDVAVASAPELPWSDAAEGSPAAEALESVVPERQPAQPPIPANDVVSGPVVQPIVIGSDAAPPLERKRGWWRRR
jgi:hypothetical protein